MTACTVLDADGNIRAQGYTAEEAAAAIMTYDGHEFEIRKNGDQYELWTTPFSRNSSYYCGLVKSTISAPSEEEIYEKVLAHADWFKGQSAMTDADYAAAQAEADEVE